MGVIYEELNKLRKERDKAELELKQTEHQITRKTNQIAKLEQVGRKQRTHMLCFKAGYMEAMFPIIKNASKTDFIQFCNGLVKIPGVKEYANSFKPTPIEEDIK